MSTTKKKKTAREKRVLIASVICAGLIIAGSTFAWFTSTDEVTNRLTANADYGVSIVESFEPPANWIPGQDINKDVYAVNTGNIDAFVKESISGKLTYTYETLTSTAPSGEATGYVELSSEDIAEEAIDGATTMEAGSFLAWTDTAEPLGEKSSARIEDGVENRWTPSAPGVYVFRRSIDNNTFSYSGYYYDGNGKYYKIVLGDDTYPATVDGANRVYDVITEQENLGTGIEVDSEGKIISGTPDFSFVKEETKSNIDVTLAYEAASTAAGDAHPARLVASYKAAGSDAAAPDGHVYDSTATAARAEIDYLNAQGKNDIATKSYKLALADLAYASSLANASNDLIEAAKAQSELINGTNGSDAKKTDADNARVSVNNAAIISGFDNNDLIYSAIVDPAVVAYADLNANSAVAANYTKMQNLWNQMYGANGVASEIETALGTLDSAHLIEAATAEDEAAQAATALTNAQTVKTKLAELKALMEQYKQAYADLDDSTATATGLTTAPGDEVAARKGQIQTFIDALPTAEADSLVTTAQSYKDAAEDYKAAAVTAGEATWSAAINAYNSALSGASDDYTAVLGELGAPFDEGSSYDHRIALADTYGLYAIAVLPDTATYTDYATAFAKELPTDTLEVTAPDPDNNANLTGTPINDATKTVAQWKTTAGSTFAAEKNAELNSNSTPITIYINLAQDYDAEWEFDTSTDGTTSADFYLKKILEASKTSEKLVDSVKLADTVTAGSYKDMTFDLNVGLESAQVTFDENNNIKTDAITTWSKQATVNQSDKTVSWN